ncbi:kinase subunit of RNA polymerase II carboxy-terminal domain kinase I [Coemansia sp. RSA 1813]|nr:kinase subunit of RNA polymerase II carboxy-terminal domain kinase I [Coemansia sp. RSA 1843]KAJ2214763.1 kinase subunit of RNA polymerase II carboxy-terminal domain kinase I [Coemansia sp. RSA 487]KAJ2569750.1 kinase subunit of RNA polymerase II carboxy-terminal domain kinase I [Coemansia sp. RSA 1813]
MSASEKQMQEEARTLADAQVSGSNINEPHQAGDYDRTKNQRRPSSRSSAYKDDRHNVSSSNRSERSTASLEHEHDYRPRDSGNSRGYQKGARRYSPSYGSSHRHDVYDRRGSRAHMHSLQRDSSGYSGRYNSRWRPRSPPRQRTERPHDHGIGNTTPVGAAESNLGYESKGISPNHYTTGAQIDERRAPQERRYEDEAKNTVHYRREEHEAGGYWGAGATESRDRYGRYSGHRHDFYTDQNNESYHQRTRRKRSRSRSISSRQKSYRRRYNADPGEHYASYADNRRRDGTRGTAREYSRRDYSSASQQRSRSRVRDGRRHYGGCADVRDGSSRDRDYRSVYRERGGAPLDRSSRSPSLMREPSLPGPPDLSPSLRITDSFDPPPPPPSTSPPPLPPLPPPPASSKHLLPPPLPKNMPPLPPLPLLPPPSLPPPSSALLRSQMPAGTSQFIHATTAADGVVTTAGLAAANTQLQRKNISFGNAAEGGGPSFSTTTAGDVVTTSTPATPASPKQKSPADGIQLYTRISMVGEGTYGKVYKARNRETGQIVALKRMRVDMDREGFPITAMREIRLLKQLKHSNITQVLDVLPDGRNAVYVVMEYMDYDLSGLVNHPQWNPEPAHKKSLMSQLLEGLAFMHAHGILHRDIKGSNLLVNQHGQVKYVDFGLARSFHHTRMQEFTNRVITLWYRPPELLLGTTVYGPEVDIWSLGCVLLELFMKKPAFQGQNDIDQLEQIFKVLGTPSPEVWDSFKKLPWTCYMTPNTRYENCLRATLGSKMSPCAVDLISWMLSLSPAERPSAAACLSHDYFVEPPAPMPPTSFPVSGDWHEYESKAERRKRKQHQKQQQQQQQHV